jgi:hypothetical protein
MLPLSVKRLAYFADSIGTTMQLPSQMFSEALTGLRLADLTKSDNDRRRYTRFVVQARLPIWPVKGDNEKKEEASSILTRDISMEGIGLIWPHSASDGEQFILALPREKKNHTPILCTIKHIRPLAQGVWGVGAQFSKVLDHVP